MCGATEVGGSQSEEGYRSVGAGSQIPAAGRAVTLLGP